MQKVQNRSTSRKKRSRDGPLRCQSTLRVPQLDRKGGSVLRDVARVPWLDKTDDPCGLPCSWPQDSIASMRWMLLHVRPRNRRADVPACQPASLPPCRPESGKELDEGFNLEANRARIPVLRCAQ